MPERIYLDNAATSWPKPPQVCDAVDRYQRECGAPAGRGTYAEAAEVERLLGDARARAASLVGADAPRRIIFTTSGTDSLNLALQGLLRSGDHVVTSVLEHNSVLRPLTALRESLGVEVTYVDCDGAGRIDPAAVEAALRPQTRLVALIHASNVTGALQPVAEVGRLLAGHPAALLVDAAQSLGHFPFTVEELGCDLLAAPGHKGLLGPLGTGLLYVGPRVEEQLATIRQGGTGTRSDEDRQPDALPDKFESGNHNVPGLVGLAAALEYLDERGLDALHSHTARLTARLLDGLAEIDGVTLYGPPRTDARVNVVSLALDEYDPQEVAALLESTWRLQVRAGIHCAPRMHAALGTTARGGTVRFSPGPFNTPEQIDRAIDAVAAIAAAATPSGR